MKELPQLSLVPESFPKKAARFVLKKAIHALPASVLIFAACSGGSAAEKTRNTQELENKESGYSLPFPQGETWFLTTGPHGDGYSKGIKYAIDIAPPELGRLNGNCPTDGSRLSIDNRFVTASASGKITLAGNGQRTDPAHSVVDVTGKDGLAQRYIHVDPISVKKGNKVKQGDPLGNPSCEYPPGGGNTGPHVHIGLMKDGQAIPIDGVVVGGWTIHEDGTMTKPGEQTRTANVGRFGESTNGIRRNDLPNNPNRAVVALPKDPIPPISGKVTERKVEGPTPTAIPTPKPTETPKPTSKSTKEILNPIEKQVQEAALRTWLNLWMTHSQSLAQPLNIDIVNTNIEEVINKNGDIGKPLDITWAGGTLHFGNKGNQVEGFKSTGEVQIDKIRAQTSGFIPTSEADKANGLQWVGGINITYIIRSRGNTYWPDGGGWGSDKEAVERWLVSKDKDTDLPAFSEWRQDSFSIGFQVKNGKLGITRMNDLRPQASVSRNVGLLFPSSAIAQDRQISYSPATKFP